MATPDIRAVSEFKIRKFTNKKDSDPVKILTLDILNYLQKNINECPQSLAELNSQYEVFMSIYSCLYLDEDNLTINYWSKGEYDNKKDVFEFLVKHLAKLQTTDNVSALWVELDDKGYVINEDFRFYDRGGDQVDTRDILERAYNLS